jgi:pimeloyl-ACP methyl ester carboxylesterase
MPEQFRVHDRTVTYLDSAPWPSGVAQRVAPVGLADGGQGAGPQNTLVLIHAFPMNADMWEAQLDAVPAGWRYLAPDLRGFGRSDPDQANGTAAPSLDDYARDILALLDHLRVDRAVIAGLSMGGYAAFAVLRLAPMRVRGLVLANTRAEADSEEARKGRTDMLDLLAGGGVAAVVDQMLPRLLGETSHAERPAIVRRVRAFALANSAEGVRGAIVRMMNRRDATPLLPGIQCPTLVIASDEDAVTPADRAREMLAAIPGAQLSTIAGAGHLSNLEQPGDFNLALRHFLSQRLGG